MAVEITRPGKHSLILETPVMPAAGTFGFGEVYRDFVEIEKLGAVITAPVTYEPWSPATGTRVVPLDAGILVHTGLPNPGLNKILKEKRKLWHSLPLPVILHLVGTADEHVRKSAARIDEEDSIDAIELGLYDDISWKDASLIVRAAVSKTEKPVMVRLPLQDAYEIADAVADAGASTLVIGAPPRGTARDPVTGRLVSGRIYGPLVKPIVLRVVGQLCRRIDIPIVGAGGIHSAQDARDYIDAGAVAVQLDSVFWIHPQRLEVIARDLGGWIVTRESGALPDEWHEGMGDTESTRRQQEQNRDAPTTD
jgi:dihydroorotate dehydrogenase (NAD+) catalytic subunit